MKRSNNGLGARAYKPLNEVIESSSSFDDVEDLAFGVVYPEVGNVCIMGARDGSFNTVAERDSIVCDTLEEAEKWLYENFVKDEYPEPTTPEGPNSTMAITLPVDTLTRILGFVAKHEETPKMPYTNALKNAMRDSRLV